MSLERLTLTSLCWNKQHILKNCGQWIVEVAVNNFQAVCNASHICIKEQWVPATFPVNHSVCSSDCHIQKCS